MSEPISPPPTTINGGESPRLSAEPASQGMKLREIVALLLDGKWWIAGITAAVLALAFAYAFFATPIYSTDAMIQIRQQTSPLAGLAGSSGVLSALLSQSTQAAAEIQIMTSRAVLYPVIRRLSLDVAVKGAPPVAVVVRQLKVPSAWIGRKLRLRVEGNGAYTLFDPDGAKVLAGETGKAAVAGGGKVRILVTVLKLAVGKHIALERQPVLKTFRELEKRLSAVELGRDTGIVQLVLEGPHPARIRRVLNVIVDQYLVQNVATYSARARKSLAFIRKQLPNLKRQMDAAASRLTAYQIAYGMVNLDEQTKALLQEFNTLEAELSQLELARAALAQQYTQRFPAYVALVDQEQNVKGKIAVLKSELGSLPQKEQGYARLLRDATVYTTLYTTLLGKAQDLRLAAAGAVGSAHVVEDAVTPIKPVKPNRLLVVLLGFLLGFGLGLGVVFLRRALRHGIEDPEILDERLGLPVLAVLAHSAKQRQLDRSHLVLAPGVAHLLVVQEDGDQTTEGLRSLHIALQLALPSAGPRILCVASLGPGEGKSFISANLAYLFAQGGLHVLLVDGDLRRGHLHRVIGLPRGHGFAELLQGDVGLPEVVRQTQLENLHVITTGVLPKDASNLLIRSDMGTHLRTMSAAYDLVVMDIPPVLAVGDALILARHATHNLLLIKHGLHSLRQVRFAMKSFERHEIEFAGCILNDVSVGAQRYAYREYGYQYKYK